MKKINIGFGYLLLSFVSFCFSTLGFFGVLKAKGQEPQQSVYLGIIFLFAAIFFVSCYLKHRRRP